MKILPLSVALVASFAVIAPAASAKTSIRQAERACTAAAKELPNVKSVRATDDDQRISNATADIPLRVRHEDGASSVMRCVIDRETGEITSLEAAED